MSTGRPWRLPPRQADPSAPHARTVRDHPAAPRWLSLGPASRIVGVDPDTLRRWADDGRVDAYITPGGHRRFDRQVLERLAASRQVNARPLSSLGASPERVALAYRRSYTAD